MGRRHIDTLLLFVFSIAVFSYIVSHVGTDIQVHIAKTIEMSGNKSTYLPNFLLYFFSDLLSGFTGDKNLTTIATILILSMATAAKYLISKKIILDFNKAVLERFQSHKLWLVALGLFLCYAIPDPFFVFVLDRMYLGKFVPIVWHNSTTVLLFPFAILLFWQQLKFFDESRSISVPLILMLNALVVLNIAIKPSFIFTYIPVTFIFLLRKIKALTIKKFIIGLTPLVTGTLFLGIQYYFIYRLQQGSFYQQESSVAISEPFEVLLSWIPFWFIPISLMLSLALPLCTMIIDKDILKNKAFHYSLILFLFGLLISVFVKETGPRISHGNFMWQNIICCYLLFLSTVSYLTPKFLNRDLRSKKEFLLLFLFGLHALSGIFYLLKIIVTDNYL